MKFSFTKKSLNFHFRIFFYFIAPLFPFGVSAADTINDDTDGVAVIDGSVAIGDEAYADYVGSVAIGEHSMAMTSTYGTAVGATSEANGNYSVSVGYDSSVELTATEGTAVGPHAVVLHENSVALGGNSRTTRTNEVNVGSRVIGGLLDARENDDAVTKRQLDQATQITVTRNNGKTTENIQIPVTTAIKDTANQVESLASNTNRQFASLRQALDKNRRRADAGIAGAMAMTAIPAVPGKTVSFGLAVSGYRDQEAVAAGLHINTSQNSAMKINASWDGENGTGVAAGMSFGW
ncbi:YadA-like family protein [Escherichia coli]